jgi:hypothetical protein
LNHAVGRLGLIRDDLDITQRSANRIDLRRLQLPRRFFTARQPGEHISIGQQPFGDHRTDVARRPDNKELHNDLHH